VYSERRTHTHCRSHEFALAGSGWNLWSRRRKRPQRARSLPKKAASAEAPVDIEAGPSGTPTAAPPVGAAKHRTVNWNFRKYKKQFLSLTDF